MAKKKNKGLAKVMIGAGIAYVAYNYYQKNQSNGGGDTTYTPPIVDTPPVLQTTTGTSIKYNPPMP